MKEPEKKSKKVVVGPNFLEHWWVYDFQLCADVQELKQTIAYINSHGYDLIAVTQDGIGVYTVFFRCRACG